MRKSTILGLSISSLVAVLGITHPAEGNPQCGIASYYTQGMVTASGERFNTRALTAAHPWLPFGTRVRVVDQATNRSVTVRINDRGPHVRGRIIDLTSVGMNAIASIRSGTRRVCLHW
jgi:rare lipoprotein A